MFASSAEKLRAIDVLGHQARDAREQLRTGEQLDQRLDQRGLLRAHRVEEVRRRTSVACTGSCVAAERGERLAEARDHAVVPRHRAVAGLAGDARAHPAEALLGDLDRIERGVAEVEREAAGLADRVLRLDLRAVLLDEEPRAEIAAGLLVGDGGEDDVAIERASARARAGA